MTDGGLYLPFIRCAGTRRLLNPFLSHWPTRTSNVRYRSDDVDAAIKLYTEHLDFQVELHPAPGFAALVRDDLRLRRSRRPLEQSMVEGPRTSKTPAMKSCGSAKKKFREQQAKRRNLS